MFSNKNEVFKLVVGADIFVGILNWDVKALKFYIYFYFFIFFIYFSYIPEFNWYIFDSESPKLIKIESFLYAVYIL